MFLKEFQIYRKYLLFKEFDNDKDKNGERSKRQRELNKTPEDGKGNTKNNDRQDDDHKCRKPANELNNISNHRKIEVAF